MTRTDTQFLGSDELSRIPECINAMANSLGGIIRTEDGREIRVDPLEWYEKPAALDGRVWRRVEGVNVVCGVWAKSVTACRDACDDFPADDAVLRDDELDEFRESVLALHPELTELTRDEFLRRSGIFSGKHITSAGALMFGGAVSVRAVLTHKDIHAEIYAADIWEAYSVLLPKLILRISAKSAGRVRNALVSALLHSDYNIDTRINISILSEPPRIIVDSPGLITPSLRNHRLIRTAELAGISAGVPQAEYDMLNFRTVSTINIEGISAVKL